MEELQYEQQFDPGRPGEELKHGPLFIRGVPVESDGDVVVPQLAWIGSLGSSERFERFADAGFGFFVWA